MPELQTAPAYAVQLEALRNRFIAGLPARLHEIESAKDTADLELALHRLAGAAGAFGYDDMGLLARAAMQTCKADAKTTASSNALQALKAAIHAHISPD